jgi:malate synthase
MEDAATAEISRAQVWQWIRQPGGVLNDGRKVTRELFQQVLDEELGKIKAQIGEKAYGKRKFDVARELFEKITTDDHFVEFLTLPGYKYLN